MCTVADGGSKKTDREFGCSQSSSHTTTDAESDINKLTVRLMEAEVTRELSDRTSSAFEDPTEKGLNKMFNTSWIQDTMSKSAVTDDDLEVGEQDTVVNLDYELTDAL